MVCSGGAFAQVKSDDFETAFGQALEILNNGEDGQLLDAEYLYQILSDYYKHPLNLNTASTDEIEDFPLLNPLQKNNLKQYRNKYGVFLNWYDLARVEAISAADIQLLKIFCTLEETQLIAKRNFQDLFRDANKELSLSFRRDLELREGFRSVEGAPPVYPGSPWRSYGRLRINNPRLFSAALLFEKDPGEKFWRNKQPEFLTGHLYYNGSGILKQAVVGDYIFRAGQDLTLGPPFAFSKSSNINTLHRTGKKIRPNTSVAENTVYRGAAIALEKRGWELALGYSNAPRDASLDSNGNISALPISGLHRTESEYSRKNRSRLESYLVALEKNWQNLKVGLSGTHYSRSTDSIRSIDNSKASFSGIYAEYTLDKGLLFGEYTRDLNQNTEAYLMGLLVSLHPQLNFGALYRNYPASWNNAAGNPFSGYGRGRNERGLYTGFEFQFNKHWVANFYVDQQINPGPDSRSSESSLDQDFFFQLSYLEKRRINVYTRFRYRISGEEQNTASERLAILENRYQSNIRLHADLTVSKEVSLRYRVEYLFNEKGNSNTGTLFYQDLSFKPLEKSWDFVMRFAWFSTSTFNERIYAYENDLLYSFSIPPYYGKGIRYYAKVGWDISYKISAWLRYATWIYQDRASISSGNNLIRSNQDPDLALMLRLKF
ncbi:MAG: ComEA family DNA-binding protein [Luteibaculum sp.]